MYTGNYENEINNATLKCNVISNEVDVDRSVLYLYRKTMSVEHNIETQKLLCFTFIQREKQYRI